MIRPALPTKEGDSGEAGFTVVELLIAFTLVSLLSILIASALRFGFKAWERNTVHTAGIEEILSAQSLLRRRLGRAYPLFSAKDPVQRGHAEFSGDARSISFWAGAPIALGAGYARFTVSAPERDGHTDLILTVVPEFTSPHQASQTENTVLVRQISHVEWAFFGRRGTERQAAWHNEWTNETALPQLVRLRLVFPPGDVRTWPELVIAPRIDVDVGCVYDALTKGCRGR